MNVALLHATRGRPAKAVETAKAWLRDATWPHQIEHIFAVESTDDTRHELMDLIEANALPSKVVVGNYGGSAPAWNGAYLASSATFLVQLSDDFTAPVNWDARMLGHVATMTEMWEHKPIVIEILEHHRRDRLMTMFVCNRRYAEMEGHFLCPLYQSMFSDDEVSFRARKNAALGRCVIVDARDVVFTHRCHYHDKSVPFDSTYAFQNHSEAYANGQRLFMQRNPTAYGEDLKLWK